jgi:hypothetical protein
MNAPFQAIFWAQSNYNCTGIISTEPFTYYFRVAKENIDKEYLSSPKC